MRKLITFSGAGMGAESGIPTFQGGNGLWDNHHIEDVCFMDSFEKNHGIVSEFYDKRRKELRGKMPHEGFDRLKKISALFSYAEHFTTNVDNLYDKAGIPCTQIHGSLEKIHCQTCLEDSSIGERTVEEAEHENLIHHKEHCTKPLLKPKVTFYGEGYEPHYPGMRTFQDALKTLQKDDVFLIIGSSLDVVPADIYAQNIYCHNKININPNRAAGCLHDAKNWKNIFSTASEGLKQVYDMLLPKTHKKL